MRRKELVIEWYLELVQAAKMHACRQNVVYISYSNALSKEQKQCEEGELSQTLPLFLFKTLTG